MKSIVWSSLSSSRRATTRLPHRGRRSWASGHRFKLVPFGLLVAYLIAWSPVSYAQQPDQAQYPRTNRHALAACERDRARFCPTLSENASVQNESICLKYFKSNISLSCRRALSGGK